MLRATPIMSGDNKASATDDAATSSSRLSASCTGLCRTLR